MAGSVLVNLQDISANAAKLASFVCAGEGKAEEQLAAECNQLAAAQNYAGYLEKLLSAPRLLFKGDNEKNIEGVFAWLGSLLVQHVSAADRARVVGPLSEVILSETERPRLRLRIISSLFNLLKEGSLRSAVFRQLVSYATRTGHVELVSEYLHNLQSHLRSWSDDTSEASNRDLFFLSYEALRDAGETQRAQQCLVTYLSLFEGADAQALAEVKAQAAVAVIGAMQAPLTQTRGVGTAGLLAYAAVRQLEEDAEHQLLFKLLRLFADGNVEQYQAFFDANQANIEAYGLSREQGLENTRLLCLCSLAAVNRELEHAAVAAALDVDETEVENWVIKAVTAELIEAQIDQMGKRILIDRAAPRIFDSAQWGELNEKLQNWRSNVRQLLGVVQGAKMQRAKAMQRGGGAATKA